MMQRARYLAFVVTAAWLSACGDPDVTIDPPGPPSVDDVPALTNQNPLTITGSAEAGARIAVSGGDDIAEATAGDDGAFSVEVVLEADAENTLRITQAIEDAESAAVTITVTHDGTPPETPTVDPVVSPTRRTSRRIRGMTEPGAEVRITGALEEASGAADESGRFDIPVQLETHETVAVDNALSVVAIDAAGNESGPAELTIRFDPNIAVEAPLLDDFPRFTNASAITLTGEAEEGADIRAVGGESDGAATVEDDGSFSVEVGLRPNQRNMILVFASVGDETSLGAVAVITHDDIAPAAPVVDPEASPTGADVVTLTGTAEPNAEVVVTGGASGAGETVDGAGAFAVDVMLNADTENVLVVTAVDAAGNESEAVSLTIEHDSALEDPIRVDRVASPTREETVTLTGTAAPDVDVEITGGAATVNTHSDAGDGSFSASVALNLNARNELRITRPGSGVDAIVVIVHDDTAPSAPTLNDIASPTPSAMIVVSGTSEPGATLSVTGGVAAASDIAGSDGRFAVDVTIAADTDSTLSVIATDRAGNSSPASTVTVTHSSDVPDAPIVDDANPPPTNLPMTTITGRVTSPGPGVTIEVAGGSAFASGATDPTTGVFSVDVPLNANAVNSLSVTSITGAIGSSPVIVTITHDDIAPAMPDGSAITAQAMSTVILTCFRNGGTVFGSAGSVEGSSRVFIWNVTAGQSEPTPTSMTGGNTTATDMGSFTTGHNACPGDVIRIKVMDAAGNVSPFVEVSAS